VGFVVEGIDHVALAVTDQGASAQWNPSQERVGLPDNKSGGSP